ncbi:flavoprotein monooxygenase [Coprinopsis sp. MPI-PUGE-AT-0042]|nr:flavoprotein monooxygenase [Coprinopsis sp. MPI-PUGE-AT-0042]
MQCINTHIVFDSKSQLSCTTSSAMSQKPLSILISGAGVAGATLALALARHPTMNPKPIVTLLERFEVPRTTGQAIDIRGPGVRLLHELGIEEKVKTRHTTEEGMIFVDKGGKEVAKFDKTNDPNRQSSTSEYEILRGELVELLLNEIDAAKKISGVEVNAVFGEFIESLNEEADGVAVTFVNGKLKPQKFDVVIAADGMSSRTRPMMFPEYKSLDCVEPWGFYIAYFTIPRVEGDTNHWKWYQAPGGLAVHTRPHRNKSTVGAYLTIMLPKRMRSPELDAILAQGVPAQKALLRDRFKNAGWQIERVLHEMDGSEDFYMHPVGRVETPRWTSGRCAIVGDAAYAVMGVGTTNAMIGGYMIAGELAKAKENSAEEIGAALKRYEDGLRPLAAGESTKPPALLPQLISPQSSWGIAIFHAIAWFVASTGMDRLLMGFGEPGEDKWKLPDYGYGRSD